MLLQQDLELIWEKKEKRPTKYKKKKTNINLIENYISLYIMIANIRYDISNKNKKYKGTLGFVLECYFAKFY